MMGFVIGTSGKYCEKPAFSSFPTLFSKSLFIRVVKSNALNCLSKDQPFPKQALVFRCLQ